MSLRIRIIVVFTCLYCYLHFDKTHPYILIHKPIDILNYIKRINSFPNAYITYRIILTISVSVASTSLSKLKLIKFYLRSTMYQQGLNELALLSIEFFLNKINYDNLIDNFTSQKT